MLTHDEKYVLKEIIKLSQKDLHINSNDELREIVSSRISNKELDAILDSLNSKNFFKGYQSFHNGGRLFWVTHETQKYTEITIKKALNFLLTSIVVPAVVSLITAWITVGR